MRADGARLKVEGFSVIAIESRRGSFSPLRSLRDFFRTLKVVRGEHADIVHCVALRPVVIGGIAAKLAGTGALVLAPTGLGHLWIERGHRRAFRPQDRERHRRLMAPRSADSLSVREL